MEVGPTGGFPKLCSVSCGGGVRSRCYIYSSVVLGSGGWSDWRFSICSVYCGAASEVAVIFIVPLF